MPRGHVVFAALYDRLNAQAERAWAAERRARLLERAHGDVLEVGAGTGANLRHYRDVERVVLAEPDPAMRRKLEAKLGEASVPVELVGAGAEALPFAEESFDGVVATFVLCSVADPGRALAEIRRVLRPGGRLLFLEHVRGEGRRARWQDRLAPLWRRVAAGCNPNRETVAAIEAAGFRIDELERFRPSPAMPLVVPVAQGAAVRV